MVGLPPMRRRKKEPARSRNPHITYKRQNAYHYSAKRAGADRLFDRVQDDNEKKPIPKGDRPRRLQASVTLGVIVVILLLSTSLTPNADLKLNGSKELVRDKKVYQQKADEILGKSYTNRSKLLFDNDKMASDLQSSFQEFSDVSVETSPFSRRPEVRITLAAPTLLLSSGNRIYLLDNHGKTLFDTTTVKPAFDIASLPLIQDQSAHQIEVGKQALTKDQIAYITEIRGQSGAKNLQVDSMILVNGGGELDVRYVGVNYFVKFNLFEDARKSMGNFLATREKTENDGAKPAEYIDVRIPERAYVK